MERPRKVADRGGHDVGARSTDGEGRPAVTHSVADVARRRLAPADRRKKAAMRSVRALPRRCAGALLRPTKRNAGGDERGQKEARKRGRKE